MKDMYRSHHTVDWLVCQSVCVSIRSMSFQWIAGRLGMHNQHQGETFHSYFLCSLVQSLWSYVPFWLMSGFFALLIYLYQGLVWNKVLHLILITFDTFEDNDSYQIWVGSSTVIKKVFFCVCVTIVLYLFHAVKYKLIQGNSVIVYMYKCLLFQV